MATTTYTNLSMSVRNIGARTDSAASPVDDLSAEEDRLIHEILTAGVLTDANAFLPARGLAASMNVIIGSGVAKSDLYVVPGLVSGQGTYVVRLEAATQTIALGAADGSLARIDEVYIVIRDNVYDGSGLGIVQLATRKGDAAASPSAPGPDGTWDAYALIASIEVPAAAADILACTLTDERATARLNLVAGGLTPVGGGMPFFGAAAPDGYLLADGSAISRTTYARLFSVIGTTYGVGDGATTFNLPDLRQRFPLGKAASGTGNTLGATGGQIDHTHTGPSHTHTGPAHTHTVNPAVDTTGTNSTNETVTDQGADGSYPLAVVADSGHTHDIDIPSTTSSSSGTGATGASGTGATGGGNPPYLVVNYIVRY